MNILRIFFGAENQYWLKNSPKKDLYLYFELQADKAPGNNKRIPLNISLVMDRSGSMAGEKLAYVKKAVDFVIDNLTAEDYLSIVQYDDKIEVLSQSAKVNDKAGLHRKVNQIQERGMTNLSGGMLEGYNQVYSTQQNNYVNRVLLLSDGLANEGITDTNQLQQITQKKFREQGIALSTFGVGADFNEVLMTNLSEYGGANYYFIDTPDKIPQIFAKELEGLLSVVTQNTKLLIRFPNNYLKCEKVYGYPSQIFQNEVNINFNDVFSEEKKAVLIKFEITRPIDQDLYFEAELGYEDVVYKLGKITEKNALKVAISSDEAQFKLRINAQVIEQVALFVANDMFEEAILKADSRDFEGAKKIIEQIKLYLDKHFQMMPPNEELKKQYQQILDYENKLQEMATMTTTDYLVAQKMSRMASYSFRKKK